MKHKDIYYNGMKIIREGQYMSVYMPQHHLASKKGTVYVHRLVAEEKLGRLLKKTEYVHHIDENKSNNAPENILVFKTRKDHVMFHHGCKIRQEGDVWVAIPKEHNTCKTCGKEITRGANFCKTCYIKPVSSHIPDRDTLSQLTETYSYQHIGRIYGVSGNAVKKWCNKYNISKKTRIEIPPKSDLIEDLLKSTREDVAKKYNASADTVAYWENLYGIKTSGTKRVKCVETNEVFENRTLAAQAAYPSYTIGSAVNGISKSCKTGCEFNNYHWLALPNSLLTDTVH